MALHSSALLGTVRDFRKLDVWNLGREFAVKCYEVTSRFPKEEQFGLSSQIRRACVSIPSNVAEGTGRDSDAEFLRFLRFALGSLNELETLFAIASDLGMISESDKESVNLRSTDLGVKLRNLATKVESDIKAAQRKP